MKFKLDYEKDYIGIFIMSDGRDRWCISRYSPRPEVWDGEYTLTRYDRDSKIMGVDIL
jgi:hypothetical protein